jgi:hypothetical protein
MGKAVQLSDRLVFGSYALPYPQGQGGYHEESTSNPALQARFLSVLYRLGKLRSDGWLAVPQ